MTQRLSNIFFYATPPSFSHFQHLLIVTVTVVISVALAAVMASVISTVSPCSFDLCYH